MGNSPLLARTLFTVLPIVCFPQPSFGDPSPRRMGARRLLMFPGPIEPIGQLVQNTSRVNGVAFQGGMFLVIIRMMEILIVIPDGRINISDPHVGVLRL